MVSIWLEVSFISSRLHHPQSIIKYKYLGDEKIERETYCFVNSSQFSHYLSLSLFNKIND